MGFSGDTGLYTSILLLLAIAGFFCIAGGLSGQYLGGVSVLMVTLMGYCIISLLYNKWLTRSKIPLLCFDH